MNNKQAKRMLAQKTAQWFAMLPAQPGSEVDRLDIVGVIGGSWFSDGVSLTQFLTEARKLKAAKLEVHISSPGGAVSDGLAIYNYLSGLKAKGVTVETYVDGLAASIASVIAMAGDTRFIGKASSLLIHRPWMMACGNAGNLRQAAEDLDKVAEQLAGIYADRSGLDLDAVRSIMTGEADADGTLLTAQDAIANGLADEIVENKLAAAACIGADIYDLNDPEEDPAPEEDPEAREGDSPTADQPPAGATRPEDPEEEEPSAAPDGAMEGEPEEVEEEPATEEELEEELQNLRNELAELRAQRDKLARTALAPEPSTPDAAPATWHDAVEKVGYEEARRRFPRLYAEFMKKYN